MTAAIGEAFHNEEEGVELWILRHGQATHNPRAEAAREAGCTFEEFLELTKQDDSPDSDLTPLGVDQARGVHARYGPFLSKVDAVVSSPLSRALRTADLAAPHPALRIVHESFREINGLLLNARRRTKSEIEARFPRWNLGHLEAEDDASWTHQLEDSKECAERAYSGLVWMLQRQWAPPLDETREGRRRRRRVLLVAHGGLLKRVMSDHPRVSVRDGRTARVKNDHGGSGDKERALKVGEAPRALARASDARFGNCELRRYLVEWHRGDGEEPVDGTPRRRDRSPSDSIGGAVRDDEHRKLPPRIVLTELNLPNSYSVE
jgi:broad specificity phosphatase PhoE